jgi:hypothetical protein
MYEYVRDIVKNSYRAKGNNELAGMIHDEMNRYFKTDNIHVFVQDGIILVYVADLKLCEFKTEIGNDSMWVTEVI